MQYIKIDNVLDIDLLEYMYDKYSTVKSTDRVSNDIVNAPATLNGTIPDWHLAELDSSDRMAVLDSLLRNNPGINALGKFNRAEGKAHKMGPGSAMAPHSDPCLSSITICLTDEYTGGEFNELDDHNNVINTMRLDKNSACVYYGAGAYTSPPHSVSEITSGNRITLQLFVPDDQHKKS